MTPGTADKTSTSEIVNQGEQESGSWKKMKIVHVLTDCVTESADIGLLVNFPTRGLPKAALVLTNARPD